MLRRILPALLISKTFFATLLKTLNETGPRLQSVEPNIWPGHNIPNRPPIVMSKNPGLPPPATWTRILLSCVRTRATVEPAISLPGRIGSQSVVHPVMKCLRTGQPRPSVLFEPVMFGKEALSRFCGTRERLETAWSIFGTA